MENIVDQIAREVMLKLKTRSVNRGAGYSPPPAAYSAGASESAVHQRSRTGQTAVLVTANFKVVDQVLSQIGSLFSGGGKLILSTFLCDNFPAVKSIPGVEVLTSKSGPAQQMIHGIREILIPSLSMNTMSKAANLQADSYASQFLSYALCEGIQITVTDESILDAARYFPAGVARKIDGFRRELEGMGVRFQRGTIQVKPDHKCSTCMGSLACASCQTPECKPATSSDPTSASAPTAFPAGQPVGNPLPANAVECLKENCPRTYGSCAASCAGKVKQVVQAGADRIEKGLDAPIPGPELARYIDHTLLKANATTAEITKLCEEARQNVFASVCVNSGNVALAAKLLQGCPTKVCAVVGFPLGATSTFTKVMETRDCIANGASEIDMVINVGALKSKDYELAKNDIARVVEAANGRCVKVILETSLLNNEEKIKACELAKWAGADFVKTSTGFSTGGATVEDIALMRRVVGPAMGVKASGGIRDQKTAQKMIAAGATRIGASASVAIVKGDSPAGKGY